MDRTIVVLSEEEKEEKLVEVLNKLKNEEVSIIHLYVSLINIVSPKV